MNPFKEHSRRVVRSIGPRPPGKYSHFFHPSISVKELKAVYALSTDNHEKGAITRAIKEKQGIFYEPTYAQRRARAINYMHMAAKGAHGNLQSAATHLMREATEKEDADPIAAINARLQDVLTELDSLIDVIQFYYPAKKGKEKDVPGP